jgi:hypothetical protein
MSQRPSETDEVAGRFGDIRSGFARLFGFGLSVLALGIASLVAIPAMIAADGKVAWGAIALGQTIGTSGGVIALYGWALFGPAQVAAATATERRVSYLESVRARTALVFPAALAAASLAFVLAPGRPVFAGVAAVWATSTGLSANWYFVGLARPYALLMLETLPRTGGLVAGIVLMDLGHSAVMLPACGLAGMIIGFAITTMWVLRSTTRAGAQSVNPRPLREVLSSQRQGIATDFAMTTFAAAPMMIVSIVAPAIQPTYALADRFGRQADFALAPARAVLQGWVPKATGPARAQRARTALLLSAGFSIAVWAVIAVIGPALMRWLGDYQIFVSMSVALLVATFVAVTCFVRTLELVALAPFGRLNVAARAIAVSSIVGLPMVALGAKFFGTVGAQASVVLGLLICGVIEYVQYLRHVRPHSDDVAPKRS